LTGEGGSSGTSGIDGTGFTGPPGESGSSGTSGLDSLTNASLIASAFGLPTEGACYYLKVCYDPVLMTWSLSYEVV
jgi:hypothetical protein